MNQANIRNIHVCIYIYRKPYISTHIQYIHSTSVIRTYAYQLNEQISYRLADSPSLRLRPNQRASQGEPILPEAEGFHEGRGYQWIGKIYTEKPWIWPPNWSGKIRSHLSLKAILWGYIHEYTKSLKYQNNMVNNMVNHLGIYWYIPIIDIPRQNIWEI